MQTPRWFWFVVLIGKLSASHAVEPAFSDFPATTFTQDRLEFGLIERTQHELITNPPLLYLVVEDGIIESLASVNPEAAMLMHILEIRSLVPEAVPPAVGDGGALARSTPAAVTVALQSGVEDLEPLMGPLPPKTHSQFTWELTQRDSNPVLLLKHRIVGQAYAALDQPYPDIEVKLETESPDHYRARGWRCVTNGPGC